MNASISVQQVHTPVHGLSQETLKDIRSLSGRDPWGFFREGILAWAVIGISIVVSEWLKNPLVTVLSLFLIATRQNVLGLLVHEQAHYLFFRSKAGEGLVNLFAAYPLLISTDGYANVHLAHHKFYFSDKDPDAQRKHGDEWETPKHTWDLFGLFLKDLLGLSIVKTLRGKSHRENLVGSRPTQSSPILKILFYATLATLLVMTGTWKLALLYWILPLVTILQALVRWGALCEHFYNRRSSSVEETTPLIIPNAIERVLLPNLNFSFGHAYHHYFPTIPFSRLPQVHRIFKRLGLTERIQIFHGYAEYFRFITRELKFNKQGEEKMNTEFKVSDLEGFNYHEAFKRNIGLLSAKDQEILKNATVAIPGLGGVGGAHLMTLVRMGVGGFHLADQDTFQLANFNRQYGAKMSTLNANKAQVMANETLDINPDLRLKIWKDFIDENNIHEFLTGVDLVIDSVDAFSIDSRCLIYREAYARGIPVVAVGPIGFAAAYFVQVPQGMKFEEYLNLSSCDSQESKLAKFFCALTPVPHYLKYMDRNQVDSQEKVGPSCASAIALCSGVAATETLKLLTGKGKVYAMPHTHYLDPYIGLFKRYHLHWGNKGPLQRMKCWLVTQTLERRYASQKPLKDRVKAWLDRALYRDEIELLESPHVDTKKRIRMMEEINDAHAKGGYNKQFIKSLSDLIETVRQKTSAPIRILDIGAGGGGLLKAIHEWAANEKIKVQLFGLDVSEEFAQSTEQRLQSENVDVKMIHGDACEMSDIADGSFDIVISSLMVHHLRSRQQVAAFFREVHRVAKYGWLIKDLNRTWGGWLWMHFGILIGQSLDVISDGLKSVRRAYTVHEMNEILKESPETLSMNCASLPTRYWEVKGLRS